MNRRSGFVAASDQRDSLWEEAVPMFLLENPVLQRELLVNLRMKRAFVLLFVYIALLGLVLYSAWPVKEHIDVRKGEGGPLVTLFFLGQYVLLSLMVPSFAAGTITGEK